jgi:hypothetical protein
MKSLQKILNENTLYRFVYISILQGIKFMRIFRNFIFTTFFILSSFAQSTDILFDEKQDEVDMEALRKWIRDKRLITTKESGGDLSISGQVRTEFQAFDETRDGVQQRGQSGATNLPARAFDVEVNLNIDYRTERTWAAIKLEFDNDMGIDSGTLNKIRLEKGYFGGRVVNGDTFTFDIELGRRFLFNVFESNLEFSSLYDGVLFKFSKAFESIANFYFNGGAFIINDKKDHFGYVGELGMLQIKNSGLNAKYSVINWRKNNPEIGSSNYLEDLRFDFLVSQFLLSYTCTPKSINKLLKFYTAGLYNHFGEKLAVTNNQRANVGWYTGFSVGLVRKKGDWAIDTNFQYLKAQAVPDFDVAGIRRGNAAKVGLYTQTVDGKVVPTTIATAVGSGNYYGFVIDFLYAITDNLTIQQNFQFSNTLDTSIGPDLKYRQYEAEFIYAF